MVMHYSPEPRRDSDEGFNIDNAGVIVVGNDSSEEEDISQGVNDQNEFGYELLPQELPSENSDSIEVASVNFVDSASGVPRREHLDPGDNLGEIVPVTEECSNKVRPDIEINAEEVQAAMRNVTLPPSSFPPWASSIPESQWTQFIFTRLGNNME